MRVALEATRCVDLCRGSAGTVTPLEEAEAVFRQLRKQGTPIPTNDMRPAALVLQHNLALHARDKHCDRLPQIVRA